MVDTSKPPLQISPSPFIRYAWVALLQHYPGPLPTYIDHILYFGTQIGYEGPDNYLISPNLKSALLAPDTMNEKLQEDLKRNRVIEVYPSLPFLSSPLGFTPKHDGGLRRIHHLSHPRGTSVNDYILGSSSSLNYVTFQTILASIVTAGRGSIIMKRDIEAAFRNVPLAPHVQWLLGFSWEGRYYKEACLPFGLSTAPFIFNLFAEALHWIIQSFLHWPFLHHFLDDFINIIPERLATPAYIQRTSDEYIRLTEILGIPRNDKKDMVGTVVPILGIEVDTTKFEARLPQDKLRRAIALTQEAMQGRSMSLATAQKLAGYLSFCALVVRLGWVFMRHIWTFLASFPHRASKHTRRRVPLDVQHDLQWWYNLLPTFNGTLFFTGISRETAHLYTDASGIGMGGFFHLEANQPNWQLLCHALDESTAFATPLPTQEEGTVFDINVYEVQAILIALRKNALNWKRYRVVIHTDSATAQRGLRKNTLSGPANDPLRSILFLAAKHDILLQPEWISGASNALADALSRFDGTAVANWCPHWQNSYTLRTPLHRGF